MTSDRASARRRTLARVFSGVGIGGLVLAAWLALPSARGSDSGVRVLVIDRSPSVTRTRSGFDAWAKQAIRREANAAIAAHESLAVVAFGRAVRCTATLGSERSIAADPSRAWPAEADSAGPAESPLDRALLLAREIAASHSPLSLILASDGTYTGADASATLDALARDGAAFTRVELPAPDRGDAAVLSVRAPEELEPGAPLAVDADVVVRAPFGDVSYEVVFTTATSAATFDTVVELTLPASDVDFRGRVTSTLGAAIPGRTSIEARVRSKRGGELQRDAIPENDVALTTTLCRGRIVVGGITDGASRDALRELFRGSDGIQWIDLDRDRATLGDLDVLVTAGVRLDELDAARIGALVARGGGWLACGDESWLASEDGAPTLWPLLPLRPAAAPDGGADLVLLVDGSGSMTGEPFDAVLAALPDVIDAAPSQAAIETCFFAGELDGCRRMEPSTDRAARRESFVRGLPRAAPGGPTHVFAALEALARKRLAAQRPAHVVLLTDGRDTSEPDVAARGAAVRAQLDAARIQLALIAAGDAPDMQVLESLRTPTTPLFRARALAHEELATLFTRAIAGERVKSGAFVLRPTPPAASNADDTAERARSLVAAQDPSAARPPLARLVVTRADEHALVLWRADGDPACAWMRAGAGSTAACAFTPASSMWPAGSNDRAFFVPLARALGRSGKSRPPRAFEDDGMLVVSGLDPRTPALVRARATIANRNAAQSVVAFDLDPDPRDPTHARRAPWPSELDRAGSSIDLAIEGVAEPIALALPPEPEYRAAVRSLVLPTETAESRALPGERGAHPALVAVLSTALAALCASAFLGILRRGA